MKIFLLPFQGTIALCFVSHFQLMICVFSYSFIVLMVAQCMLVLFLIKLIVIIIFFNRWAIIGLTEQLLFEKVDRYNHHCSFITSH